MPADLIGIGCRPSLALLLVLAASCTNAPRRYDRSVILAELEERAGVVSAAEDVEAPPTPGPRDVVFEDGLSEREAVALALWNNAAFQESLAALGLRRADLVQAGLLSNPVFSVLFPIGPKQLEFTGTLPLEFLWLRPRRVAVAELECERVAALLVQNGLDLVRDVRTAWIELAHAQARRKLLAEMVSVREAGAAFFAASLQAGAVSELEATTARIEAMKARAQLARSDRELPLTEERLRSYLGVRDAPGVAFRTELPVTPERIDVDLERLLTVAEAARPEVRAAEIGVESASEKANLARWKFVKVAAIVDANEEGKRGFEIGPGASVELPVFDWGQGARQFANAEVEVALRHLDAVRERVALDTSQTLTRALQAYDELSAWRMKILPAMETAVKQAEGAYAAGGTSSLPLLESRRRLLEARLSETRLAADYAVSRVGLEHSLGAALDEVASYADAEGE